MTLITQLLKLGPRCISNENMKPAFKCEKSVMVDLVFYTLYTLYCSLARLHLAVLSYGKLMRLYFVREVASLRNFQAIFTRISECSDSDIPKGNFHLTFS